MLNNLNAYQLIEEQNSNGWPVWKIVLLVSVFVVFFLGVFFYIYFRLKIKKIKDKYFLDQENEILLKASENNKNFGTIVTELERQTKNPYANPILTAFLLNTFIVNNYQSIHIDDSNDDYFAKTFSLSLENKDISVYKYNQTEINNAFQTIDKLKTYKDMIVLMQYQSDYINNLQKHLNFLNEKGMCILLYNKYNKKEVNEILNYLYDQKIYKFEKYKVKSFNLILITNYQTKGKENE